MPSSVIGHFSYQEERSELVVTFTSGKTYAYGLVPRRVYDDFRRSGSKGNFFNGYIRDRYPTRRLKSIGEKPEAMIRELDRRGYVIARRVLDPFLIVRLIELIETGEHQRSERAGETYGSRDLLALGDIRVLSQAGPVMSLVRSVIGADARVVRCLFFDKTPSANWPVLWHQDLSVAVAERHEIEGWQAWSVKNGISHVQPPASLLERMLTVRLHLDDCHPDNGPLKVRPGTHRFGRLSRERTSELTAEVAEETCCANAGDALVMRPLLLHGSSPARKPHHRRVVHLEYAPADLLPPELQWAFG